MTAAGRAIRSVGRFFGLVRDEVDGAISSGARLVGEAARDSLTEANMLRPVSKLKNDPASGDAIARGRVELGIGAAELSPIKTQNRHRYLVKSNMIIDLDRNEAAPFPITPWLSSAIATVALDLNSGKMDRGELTWVRIVQ